MYFHIDSLNFSITLNDYDIAVCEHYQEQFILDAREMTIEQPFEDYSKYDDKTGEILEKDAIAYCMKLCKVNHTDSCFAHQWDKSATR